MIGSNCNDVLLVREANGGGNGTFADGGAWWIIILFLFVFCGWGNGGWGGYGSGGVQENYVLTSDFSQLSRQIADTTAMTERKLDGINNGICSLGYDQLNQMNGINTNILTTANANQMAMMNGFNTIQGAVKDCCCQTQQNIKDTQYVVADKANFLDRGIADGFCQTNFNAERNTRSIVDANNANTQAILAKLDAMENSRKDEKIAEQACIINNQYLLSQINRTPIPAYNVPNPYCNCNNGGCC